MEGLTLSEEDGQLLLAQFRRGEPLAFDRVVAAHQERVTRLAYRLLGWRGDVQDVVQEVFLAAMQRCHQFRGESPLATWLAGITVNVCRSRRRRRWLEMRWLRGQRPEVAADAADRATMRDETSVRVRAAVQALGQRDREVIVLFYLDQLSIAEIAAILEVRANVVEVRLHRARRRLKELLAGFVEEG